MTEELLQTDPAAATNALAALSGEVDDALEELRSLAHGVHPSLLDARGLEEARRGVVMRSPRPVRLWAGELGRHPAEIERAVYFICLEALQDADKHAPDASHVWVSLRQDDELEFEIGDDGLGFSPPQDVVPVGCGTCTIESRRSAAS